MIQTESMLDIIKDIKEVKRARIKEYADQRRRCYLHMKVCGIWNSQM